MMLKGSCHCGKIAFEVEGEPKDGMACNCSICQRKGSLMWFVPRDALKLLTPANAMSTYTFNKHVIQHHFCLRCGCAPFGEGKDPKGNPTGAINVRCLDDIDLSKIERMPYDGASK